MHSQFISQREISSNPYERKLSPIGKYSSDSRPNSRVKSVTGMRKKPWNRRFIYNKIPDYYQVRDKNIFLSKKPRVNSMHKNNIFDTNYITYQQSRINYNRKKNFTKGFNRTSSGFFSQNSYMTNNNDFSLNIRNMVSPLTNSALNRTNLNRDNFNLNLNVNTNDENFNSIKKMWNELCVYMSYREVFIIIYNQLAGEEKEQFYQKELNELNMVKNDIKSLNYYIEQRTLILKDLYELNVKLNRMKNTDDVINELLVEISNLIEKLRDATIDVCYAMRKLKNDMNIVSNIAKYNIDLLSSKSKFDKNYLIKMKGELSFLKEGNAKYFFNISDDRSPFLLKASDPTLNNEKDIFMRIVPLKEEIKEHIKECNYYIYQELIAYQQNILARQKMFRCVSPIKNHNKHMISNSSFINMNKEGDISQNNMFNAFGALNESNGFKRANKNIFNERPSDITSILSTHNFMEKKMGMGIGAWPGIARQPPRPNKDLFSQKLLSGFIPGDWGQEIFVEDEKVKDEKEEEKENEEEEEDEEKSEDDTTRNELNELIEEKKSETDGGENSNSKVNSKMNDNEIKKISEENNVDKEEDINNNINKKSSRTNLEKNNKEFEDNKNENNYKNEDINKYLNKAEKKTNTSKSKISSQKDENKNEKIISNNPINSSNLSQKEDDKKSIKSKSNNNISKKNSDINNKKEENNINNNIEENRSNNEKNKEEN